MPKRTEKRFSDSRGEYHCIRDYAKDMQAACNYSLDLVNSCPDGWHPWAVKLQKAERGRRCSLEVTYRRSVF